MSDKLKVGILGGTGMVGQRFITLLENHPWFDVVLVAASGRSAGRLYEEAVEGRWKMQTPMPEFVKKMSVYDMDKDFDEIVSKVDFVFCAVNMPKDEIKALEERYAKAEVPVVSNNSANRWTPDVPMILPEVNPEHTKVIEDQKKRLGTTRGFIAVKPNCSIQSYAPALAALREFEPKLVVATTYQAISGAGKTFEQWPEMVENIIPYIGGEEEKSEKEPLRLWGKVENGEIAGTVGRAKSVEAFKMNLTGEIADEYDIYYRAHSSGFGWLGWAKNGEKSGTEGYAYRLEALQIKLVPKGTENPELPTPASAKKEAFIKK